MLTKLASPAMLSILWLAPPAAAVIVNDARQRTSTKLSNINSLLRTDCIISLLLDNSMQTTSLPSSQHLDKI